MNKCIPGIYSVSFIIALIMFTRRSDAMLYSANNADLLLLFRSDSVGKNVEVDIGSVTNLLNLSSGVATNFTYIYSPNQVKTNFGNSYGTVVFNVVGVTAIGHGNNAWITDFSDSSTPANLSGEFSTMRSLIQSIGSKATTSTGNNSSSNYVASTSATTAYTYIVTTGAGVPTSYMYDFGGNLPFTDEALAGNTQNFYQFDNSGTGPATLIGTFSMDATSGAVTFTRAAGTCASVPAMPTVQAGCGSVTVTWAAVSDAAGYNLYRKLSGGTYGTAIATGLTGTSYQDGTASDPTQTYVYAVTSVYGSCESAKSPDSGGTSPLQPPVANPDSVTHNAGASAKVALDSLTANDTASGSLSLVAIDATTAGSQPLSLNGASVSTSTQVLIPAGAAEGDTFHYTVTDGHCTAVGTVTIHVTGSTGQRGRITTVTGSGPYTATMWFYGLPATQYHVQRSTDLVVWTTLGAVTADGTTGLIPYSDTNAPSGGAYYRLVYP